MALFHFPHLHAHQYCLATKPGNTHKIEKYNSINSGVRTFYCKSKLLVHLTNQSIYLVLTVAKISTLHKMIPLFPQASCWIGQFERPEEII